jgi:hypothetical protein
MSAPQTNIERQKRRHRGPIVGIVFSVLAVAILFFVYLGDEVTPEDSLLNETDAPVVSTPTTPVTPQPVEPTGN